MALPNERVEYGQFGGIGIRVAGRNQDSKLVEEDNPWTDQFAPVRGRKFENLKRRVR